MFSQIKNKLYRNRKLKTKDQKKIERLEKKLAEQKDEITNLKKDRKRLNYAIERLERGVESSKGKSSLNDIQKIKELNAQIGQLEQSIEEKELEMEKREEHVEEKIRTEENTTKFWHRKYEDLCKSIDAEHNDYYEKKLIDLIRNRKGVNERNEILKAYERGDLYYSLTENGEEKKYPMFSPYDLFIQIHPKTGLPLTKENFKVLEAWAKYMPTYQIQMGYWRDYLLNSHPSERSKIQSAYNVGKELLPLYEHLLF